MKASRLLTMLAIVVVAAFLVTGLSYSSARAQGPYGTTESSAKSGPVLNKLDAGVDPAKLEQSLSKDPRFLAPPGECPPANGEQEKEEVAPLDIGVTVYAYPPWSSGNNVKSKGFQRATETVSVMTTDTAIWYYDAGDWVKVTHDFNLNIQSDYCASNPEAENLGSGTYYTTTRCIGYNSAVEWWDITDPSPTRYLEF